MSELPGSASVRTGDPVDRHRSPSKPIPGAVVRSARIDLRLRGLNQVAYTPSVGTCTIFRQSCVLGDLSLQPGARVTLLAVHGVAASAGTFRRSIRLDTQNEITAAATSRPLATTIDAFSSMFRVTGMAIATIKCGGHAHPQFVIRNTGGVRTATTNVGVRLTSDFWAPIRTAVVTGGTCVGRQRVPGQLSARRHARGTTFAPSR